MRFHPGAALILSLVSFCCSCAGPGAGGGSTPGGVSGTRAAARGMPHAVTSALFGSLAIRKWRLDNGLEIVTLPDAAARSVSMATTFRVGSRDENAAGGETGLAHLFEHLMFAQIRSTGAGGATGAEVPGAARDFDQRIEEIGGSANAETNYDFTSYIDEIPSEGLEQTIRLEADRLANLDLTPAEVAREREVVIAERLGTIEDNVDGVLDEIMYGQAFRAHPYRWPIIGRMQDIRSITRDKALAFYRRHYTPNQAVITLAGHFDEASALEMIGAAYGAPARGQPNTPAPDPPERAPAAEVRTNIDAPVATDRMVIGFPAPPLGSPDRVAYELLAESLAGGPSSRLVRLLVVEREIASSLTGDLAATRDPGLWSIWVQVTRGNQARQAEDLIVREVARALSEPVSAVELGAIQNRLETAFWRQLQSSRARAEALGRFEGTTGDFRDLVTRGSAFARVTAEDLRRVARTYLASGARSVVVAHPKKERRP